MSYNFQLIQANPTDSLPSVHTQFSQVPLQFDDLMFSKANPNDQILLN